LTQSRTRPIGDKSSAKKCGFNDIGIGGAIRVGRSSRSAVKWKYHDKGGEGVIFMLTGPVE
jgi:hypothetical protein